MFDGNYLVQMMFLFGGVLSSRIVSAKFGCPMCFYHALTICSRSSGISAVLFYLRKRTLCLRRDIREQY